MKTEKMKKLSLGGLSITKHCFHKPFYLKSQLPTFQELWKQLLQSILKWFNGPQGYGSYSEL